MKNDHFYSALEEITEKLGYTIRKEKGNFRGDSCILEGQKMIMLNKNHPVEYNISLLSGFLAQKKLDDHYIKPAVRKQLESLWKKKGIQPISQFEEETDS